MTVSVRVIPCLDVADGRVVKGVKFQNLRDAGDPVELAAAYDAAGADEITFLDVTASADGRATMLDVVRRTAESVFIPLTVGGGVRSVDDVDALLRAGADKVAVNTAAIARPELIREIAERFGRQVLVLSVDARRDPSAGTTSGFEVTTHGGRRVAMVSDVAGGHTAVSGAAGSRVSRGIAVDAVAWARLGAEMGAGEILLNAMDTDGTRTRVRPGADRGGTGGRLGAADRLRWCRPGGRFPAGRPGGRRRGPGGERVPLRRDRDRRGQAGSGRRGSAGSLRPDSPAIMKLGGRHAVESATKFMINEDRRSPALQLSTKFSIVSL